MRKNEGGEIATIIAIGAVLIIGLVSFISSYFLNKNKLTPYKSKAAEVVVGYCDKDPKAPIPTSAFPGYKWTPLCDKSCTVATVAIDCPVGADNQTGWCFGFDGGFRCLRWDRIATSPTPTSAATPTPTPTQTQPITCNPANVNMSVSPNPGTVGGRMTFSISGTEGDLFISDNWSGGVDCTGNFWGQTTCNATSAGSSFTFKHQWKKCVNDTDHCSGFCEKTINFSINNISPTPTATPTPTPTPTASPQSTSFILKLKFQGIAKMPKSELNSMKVKITVKSNSLSINKSTTADFKTSDGLTWQSDRFIFDIPQGSDYIVLVKGPKQIQKKVCSSNPSESNAGDYHCTTGAMTINKGENVLDFSGISLLAGDLDQNGVINSADLAQVVNRLGKSDQESINIADVNLDGVVNSIDYSLIIQSLSFKFDEE